MKYLKFILLLHIVFVVQATNAYDFMVDGLCYNYNNDGSSVTLTYQHYENVLSIAYDDLSGAIIIPEKVTYKGKIYSVTAIDHDAFWNCTGLTSVAIPSSVTSIGSTAFYWCINMTNIDIPPTVKSIALKAFYKCKGLTAITIPDSLSSMGKWVFYECNELKTVNWNAKTYPDFVVSNENDGTHPFRGLPITDFNFGGEVERIPANLCYGLHIKSITIPNSVKTVGDRAFYYCGSSNSVTIPNSVETIGNEAFLGCSGVKTLTWNAVHCNSMGDLPTANVETATIGNEVELLPDNFVRESKITTITIPNTVTAIGNSAFEQCRALNDITIGNSVTSIGESAFCCCTSLTSVTIPNSVTSIGNYAFNWCSGLTSITIPNSVTSIGNGAFSNCSGLTSVTIPNSVTSIGGSAFYDCSGLQTVNWNVKTCADFTEDNRPFKKITTGIATFNFGNEVEHIPAFLCDGLSGLTSITFPRSVSSIGNNAFRGCTGLTSINISDLAAWCNILCSGYYANPLYFAHHLFLNGSEVKNLIIPNSVTTISDYAFVGCTNLTSVTLPKNLNSIGNYAFKECWNIKYVSSKPISPPTITGSMVFQSKPLILIPNGTMMAYKNANDWKNYNLRYSLTNVVPHTTQAIAVSEDNQISSLFKVKLNSNEYVVNNDSIWITDLKPNENYSAIAFSNVTGDERTDTISFKTNPVRFESVYGNSTQTTIKPRYKVYRDDAGLSIQSSGAICNGKDYTGEILQETGTYYIIEIKPITGLTPNTTYYFTPWIVCNGKKCEGQELSIKTQNISISSSTIVGPTNVVMTANYNAGDAHVTNAYFTYNGNKIKKLSLTGLNPNTSYTVPYTIVTTNGSFTTNLTFTTYSLTMSTQEAHMLSDTSPMLMATTNMADVETFCGFEWRRYDAPNEMPSTKVYCPVYNGTIAGVLMNMTPNVYYKYRPFYKANNGAEYYGNWVAFLTADAGVSFEPVVYTYKDPVVTQNTAILQGVALPGSSDITEQGFEYWRISGSKSPTGVVNNITAIGQRMSASVEGLSTGATYGFRSYVKAGGKTYYGSEEQFTTDKSSGDVNGDGKVNVSDVTALVNMILGVIPKDEAVADVNGDGKINVSDVTALVNIILGIN